MYTICGVMSDVVARMSCMSSVRLEVHGWLSAHDEQTHAEVLRGRRRDARAAFDAKSSD